LHLRGLVAGRAADRLGQVLRLGESKVGELEREDGVFQIEQDVCWLDIAVAELPAGEVRECREHLPEQRVQSGLIVPRREMALNLGTAHAVEAALAQRQDDADGS
jgi:hypothetical protein